jgi:uncharacterized membrane protein YphA (DoxX/SURF4 family)
VKNPLNFVRSSNLGLLLARLPVGVFVAIAGFDKVAKTGLQAFVTANISSVPPSIPVELGRAYLYALPFAEMLVGSLMFLGWFTRAAGLVASLLLISFMIAVTGIGWNKGTPFHMNVILLGVTLMLMLSGPGALGLDHAHFKRGGDKPKKAA